MAFTLPTSIPLGSKSRVGYASIHSRQYEFNYDNDSRNRGGNNHDNLWVCIKQMVWGQYNPYLHYVGGIADSDSVFNMTTAGSDFSLEVITRAASQVLSITEIEREIDTSSTTVSLSVFSQ